MIDQLSRELSCSTKYISACLELLSEGATVPFIARYRKERTGAMNEETIRAVEKRHNELKEFEKRKEYILKTLETKGELTESIKTQILSCNDKTVLEDIYLPFKTGKATRAQKAKNAGLDRVASLIWRGDAKGHWSKLLTDTDKTTAKKAGFETEQAIRDGIVDILSDLIANQIELRESLRSLFQNYGLVTSRPKRGWKNKESKYDRYYDYSRKASTVPPHVLSALFRGENEGVLSIDIIIDKERAESTVYRSLPEQLRRSYSDLANLTAAEALNRLLIPSLASEQLRELKEKSEIEACRVFADNLQTLLMAAPAGARSVLAIDPGFRTGCKVALLGKTGEFITSTTIYPTEPRKEYDKAADTLFKLYKKHSYELIAIGNGTGGRETEQFVKQYLIRLLPEKPVVTMISEAGASVYSASENGQKEFPDLDVTIRGAVSIGRRLQDPLAELVKIPPESIGVGQYQHDISQKRLSTELNAVVESCVNRVGTDLNLASEPLLTQISGIGPAMASKIVLYRSENGAFKSRKELLNVPGLGKKCFEQCAGFLRIDGGAEPLDSTSVHPENYSIVKAMAKSVGISYKDLIRNETVLKTINTASLISDSVGRITLNDIREELAKPARDPRENFTTVEFDERFHSIEDLSEGVVLPGVVTNVVAFGAFVDIGVHQDGLVHISELANRFVSDPQEIVKPGMSVTVKVISVNRDRKQIGLSMKQV